jgi:phosphoglycolate/pyridoxal phosphate phosphatase family enzyme
MEKHTAAPPAFGPDGIDGVMCDLDGVLYRGDVAIPGAAEAIERLRAAGTSVVFATNNSHFTVDEYVAKLARTGVEATPRDVVTSAIVTAEVLSARGFGGRRALVVGGDGIRDALALAGVGLVHEPDEADVVVVGWDPAFTYDVMNAAAAAVRAGAPLVATNRDATFPAPDGLWPGAGSILASIETASGRVAEVMGKPNEPMMDAAATRLDGARSIAVIGDRPDSDLDGGRARGWTTILVLSGVTSPEAAATLDPAPDYVVDSLAALANPRDPLAAR